MGEIGGSFRMLKLSDFFDLEEIYKIDVYRRTACDFMLLNLSQ